MTTNYDPIAEQYKRSKQQPWRTYIESHTLMGLVGDPRGISVLDLACGEGYYTRLLRQRGAARVTGVDLSPAMVELACKQESMHQQGIEYLVADARHLPNIQPCDLVCAAYLLNYARDEEELQAMVDGIARALKPGGRFVTVNSSATLHFPSAPSYRKYGFETRTQGEWGERAPIRWVFHLEDSIFELENYYLSQGVHEEAFRRAGFRTVHWHPPQVSAQAPANYDAAYWADFLGHSPVSFIECVKG
jgi:ubiquinone/menaquinone biosynthesis C-methylase UbiE